MHLIPLPQPVARTCTLGAGARRVQERMPAMPPTEHLAQLKEQCRTGLQTIIEAAQSRVAGPRLSGVLRCETVLRALWADAVVAAAALGKNPPPAMPTIDCPADAQEAVAGLLRWIANIDGEAEHGTENDPNAYRPAKASQEPADATAAEPADRTVLESAGVKLKLTEPPADALKAYRAHIATQMNQTQLAELLTQKLRRPVSQGQVSRWLTSVREWMEAANVLPPLEEIKTVSPIDPSVLDMGARQDRHTKRQRERADE
jgi:hypothetical protein